VQKFSQGLVYCRLFFKKSLC